MLSSFIMEVIMICKRFIIYSIYIEVLLFILFPCISFAQIERFIPRQGETFDVWRVTNNPTVRDWGSYHNTQCWSPDGRYLCYIHFAEDDKELKKPVKTKIRQKDL